MKKDVYKHEERYKSWKEEVLEMGVGGLTEHNSKILIQYILDMEIGRNISARNVKGPRSFPRLNNLRQRIRQIMIMLQGRGVENIILITEEELIRFFADLRTGAIRTKTGDKYRTVGDYAKVFTAFWHWWMKINRKEGKIILDISEELDKTRLAGRFVYLTKEKLEEMLCYFDEDEQVIIYFVFDTLIRAPTELMSLQVKDIFNKGDSIWVNISAEISKTRFERRFNLIYCGEALLKYIERNNLSAEDYLFDFNHSNLTKKMHTVAKQLWGEGISDPTAAGVYSELSLYDLRHSGTIHLRLLAAKNTNISLDSIRQRGGWTDFKMLNYYTKFIGLDGSIDKNELLIQEDKSRIEKEIDELKKKEQIFSQKFMRLLEIIKDHPEEMEAIVEKDRAQLGELFSA